MITDTQGNPSQTFNRALMNAIKRAWIERGFDDEEDTQTLPLRAERIAIERSVRRELYPVASSRGSIARRSSD